MRIILFITSDDFKICEKVKRYLTSLQHESDLPGVFSEPITEDEHGNITIYRHIIEPFLATKLSGQRDSNKLNSIYTMTIENDETVSLILSKDFNL